VRGVRWGSLADETSWGRDDNLDAVLKVVHLGALGHAAVDARVLDLGRTSELVAFAFDLVGEKKRASGGGSLQEAKRRDGLGNMVRSLTRLMTMPDLALTCTASSRVGAMKSTIGPSPRCK
jgi:hypothetical protein